MKTDNSISLLILAQTNESLAKRQTTPMTAEMNTTTMATNIKTVPVELSSKKAIVQKHCFMELLEATNFVESSKMFTRFEIILFGTQASHGMYTKVHPLKLQHSFLLHLKYQFSPMWSLFFSIVFPIQHTIFLFKTNKTPRLMYNMEKSNSFSYVVSWCKQKFTHWSSNIVSNYSIATKAFSYCIVANLASDFTYSFSMRYFRRKDVAQTTQTCPNQFSDLRTPFLSTQWAHEPTRILPNTCTNPFWLIRSPPWTEEANIGASSATTGTSHPSSVR